MGQHLDSALARRLWMFGGCAALAVCLLAAGLEAPHGESLIDAPQRVRNDEAVSNAFESARSEPDALFYPTALSEPKGLVPWGPGAIPGGESMQQPALRGLAAFIAERWGVSPSEARSVVALAWSVGSDVSLDPLLLLAVIAVESRFDPLAQSRRGAQGLMQVRTHLHVERFERFGGREAAFDPLANIRVGAELLKDMLVREGSTEGALKAYVGAARRPHDSGYGARVLQTRALLAEAVAESAAQVGDTAALPATPAARLF